MVKQIIRQFHITSKYKGYSLIIYAIKLYVDMNSEYVKITKDIYPVLAQEYQISIASVERNIRTVIEACWKNDRRAVQDIIGYNINKCPSNADFIEAISYSHKTYHINKQENLIIHIYIFVSIHNI